MVNMQAAVTLTSQPKWCLAMQIHLFSSCFDTFLLKMFDVSPQNNVRKLPLWCLTHRKGDKRTKNKTVWNNPTLCFSQLVPRFSCWAHTCHRVITCKIKHWWESECSVERSAYEADDWWEAGVWAGDCPGDYNCTGRQMSSYFHSCAAATHSRGLIT